MKSRQYISNELAMLAACDLVESDKLLSDRFAGAMQSGFDWDRFLEIAEGNGMMGLAAFRLARLPDGWVPGHISDRLAGLPQRLAVLQLSQTAAAVRLVNRLAQANVRSIILKGMAINHSLYATNPNWRSSGDIDILVDQSQALLANQILLAAGYRRQWPEKGIPKSGQSMFFLLANVFEYICPETGNLIELHHRITLNPSWIRASFDELYSTSVEIETGQGTIRGLGAPYLVPYLCWHAVSHLGFRLKWICDIVRALRITGAKQCESALPAVNRSAAGPTSLIDALLGVILPEMEGRPQIEPAGRWQRHTRRIFAALENPKDIPTGRTVKQLPAELAFRLFLARLSPGMAGKGYELLRALSDPRDVEKIRLGAGFAPLYALSGPFLALARAATRQPPVTHS